MIPLWLFPLATAAGNSMVLKPSERDPGAAMMLAEMALEAGASHRFGRAGLEGLFCLEGRWFQLAAAAAALQPWQNCSGCPLASCSLLKAGLPKGVLSAWCAAAAAHARASRSLPPLCRQACPGAC